MLLPSWFPASEAMRVLGLRLGTWTLAGHLDGTDVLPPPPPHSQQLVLQTLSAGCLKSPMGTANTLTQVINALAQLLNGLVVTLVDLVSPLLSTPTQ